MLPWQSNQDIVLAIHVTLAVQDHQQTKSCGNWGMGIVAQRPLP
jgi:hypothetical protein